MFVRCTFFAIWKRQGQLVKPVLFNYIVCHSFFLIAFPLIFYSPCHKIIYLTICRRNTHSMKRLYDKLTAVVNDCTDTAYHSFFSFHTVILLYEICQYRLLLYQACLPYRTKDTCSPDFLQRRTHYHIRRLPIQTDYHNKDMSERQQVLWN